ncbi:MAG: tetratricopeptide repeat protein [Spartobacteria bacterium]|nr:tetratricopeptide repeat protein [Spartobacteria bacterium]
MLCLSGFVDMWNNRITCISCLCAVFFGFFAWPAVRAEDAPERDIEFASGLVDMGFPDFAEKLVNRLILAHPDMEDSVKMVRAQVFIKRSDFSGAEAVLKSMPANNPKAQAINLAMARGYYATGDINKARDIYNDFFNHYKDVPQDNDLRRFYQESAYQMAQMLQEANDYKGAADAYERVITTMDDKMVRRGLQAELASLYIRAVEKGQGNREDNLHRAEQICQDIQWGGLDIPFGKSISTMAHVKLLWGDEDGARATLEEYLDMLKEIDAQLEEEGMLAQSPMAGARFLLGELYERKANAAANAGHANEAIGHLARALTEYYNVFVKYGDSQFGPESGMRAQGMKSRLEDEYGKEVKIDLGAHKARAGAQTFKMADGLFRNRDYNGAVREYTKMLAQYPETDMSSGALANVLRSYAEMNDTLMMKATLGYMGERFGNSDQAAIGVLVAGKVYFDRKDTGMYTYVYEQYLNYFPKHEKAGAILYTLAAVAKQNGDEAKSNEYFARLIKDYPEDSFSIKAVSGLAWSDYAAGDYKAAIKGFKQYIKIAQPGPDKAKARFCMADSYMKLNAYLPALKLFDRLVKDLASSKSPYHISADARKANLDIVEKSLFYMGYCCAKVQKPAKKIPAFRKMAIKYFSVYLKRYGQSDLAPKAMAQLGAIQLELNNFDAAVKTFNDLAARYPSSPEGENALFSLVKAAMEVKKYDVASNALNDMMSNKGAYTPQDFQKIGQIMLDAEVYADAVRAFQEVVATSDERTLLERSLFGMGQAEFAQQHYEGAAEYFSELMERYPKSGLFFEAKFSLGTSYRELGRLDEATAVLADLFKYATDAELVNKSNLILAKVQLEQGDKEGALASYQRIVLLADGRDPKIKPLIEEALLGSIPIAMELERYPDVEDNCTMYETMFPKGKAVPKLRELRRDAKRRAAQN